MGCELSLAPTDREKETELLALSLVDGTTLRRGDLIDVTVMLSEPAAPDVPEERPSDALAAPAPYTVEVELQGSDGSIVTSRAFPYRDGDLFPSLTLDDLELPSRSYRLVVQLLRGTSLLEKRVVDFYYIGAEYELLEITSDPPSVHPGSTVGLTALLKTPEGSNPILEWSWDGQSFARGELSDGLDSVPWVTPVREGIYAVRATLFPLGTSSASVSLSTDVYVARVLDPIGELGPAGSYRGLYHLLGDLADASGGLGAGTFLEGRRPPLVTQGRLVGYQLDGNGGFSIPAFLVPTRDGALEPFTVSFGFTASHEPQGGTILRATTADGTVRLTMSLDLAGPWIVAELTLRASTARLAAEVSGLRADVRTAFSFSLSPPSVDPVPTADPLAPAPEGPLTARWFVDGRQVAMTEWAVRLPPPEAGAGRTVVGGPGSARGILDELGVYVTDPEGRAATDPGIYQRLVTAQQGGSAVADGFDGMFLASAYTVEGSVSVDRGAASLQPASLLGLPAYPVGEAGIRVSLELGEGMDDSFRIAVALDGAGDTPSTLLSLTGAGQLSIGALVEVVRLSPTRTFAVTLRPQADQLRVEIEGVTRTGSVAPVFLLPGAVRSTDAVLLQISNAEGAAAPLLVDSYSIWPLH